MSTLATMVERIGREIRRPGITDEIREAINTSIEQYQSERFYFNEHIFDATTVADQGDYDEDDAGGWANLANVLKFDYVKLMVGDQPYTLDQEQPERIERLMQNGTSTGQPLVWSWYAQTFRLYPVPSDVYTIRIGCQRIVAAPASDDEADNPWMTHAENLIRCRAKFELYTHVLIDPEKSALFSPENDASPTAAAFARLKRKTNNLMQRGGWLITPVQF